MIENKIKEKNLEINDLVYVIEKKFIKLDDDYANLSRYLFNMTLDTDKELLNIKNDLQDINDKLKAKA